MKKKIRLLNGEIYNSINISNKKDILNDNEINKKYEEGEIRIVTEAGAYKLEHIPGIFKNSENYKLTPDFQRKDKSWDNDKRSRLIESFIMNIPIPPIFIYEVDYNSYEVMDGLQRLSTVINFLEDKFSLQNLEKWEELNGRRYSELPSKVKQGIARRQLSTITLLKESTEKKEEEEEMKKMVFERLNTGGVKLEEQEIRNALYDGKFNRLCIELSDNKIFKNIYKLKSNDRMEDTELVLRFFSMRNLDNYNIKLKLFLDVYLKLANTFPKEVLEGFKSLFENSIKFLDIFLGEKAYCYFRSSRGKNSWTGSQKMIFDPMNLFIHENYSIIEKLLKDRKKFDKNRNIKKFEEFYLYHSELFDGKRQSKSDIELRKKAIEKIIFEILEEKYDN